jgi:hypothetical protein
MAVVPRPVSEALRRVELGVAKSRIPRTPKLTSSVSLREGALSSVPSRRLIGQREMPPFVPLTDAYVSFLRALSIETTARLLSAAPKPPSEVNLGRGALCDLTLGLRLQ